MRKLLTVMICLLLVLSLSPAAFASGEASGGPSPNMNAVGDPAIEVTEEGLTLDPEGSGVKLRPAGDGVIQADRISGVKLTSDNNDAGGILIIGGDVTIGGAEDRFAVTTFFTGEDMAFNTVVDLSEPADMVPGAQSSGGAGVAVRGGAVTMENTYVKNEGVGRFSVSLNAGQTVMKDCYIESVGADARWCDMPWFTAQLGNSRNLIACGTLSAYIYNSSVVSEGYGSWSTDTGGSRFDFYLYNGDAINWYGGYGTYADTGLTVNVYGSRFDSAEYGVFVTNTGILNIGSSGDALEVQDPVFLENLAGQELAEDTPSEIIGGRNAVVFHVVDTMHQANPATGVKDSAVSTAWRTTPVLNVKNSVLSTVGATGQAVNRYPVLQRVWMDHLDGSTVLFRGACGDAYLTNTALESRTGVIIQSVVDLDESTIQILDDVATADIPGCRVFSRDNTWTGDISHEDYQRPMVLDFVNTTLTGAIRTKGLEDWNALFAGYENVAYGVNTATGWYENLGDPTDTAESYKAVDPSRIYGWLCPFDHYDAVRGTYLAMDAASVWNVTGRSELNGLTLAAGAAVNGAVTVNGAAVDVSRGGSWYGDIVVTPLSASGEASGGASR